MQDSSDHAGMHNAIHAASGVPQNKSTSISLTYNAAYIYINALAPFRTWNGTHLDVRNQTRLSIVLTLSYQPDIPTST